MLRLLLALAVCICAAPALLSQEREAKDATLARYSVCVTRYHIEKYLDGDDSVDEFVAQFNELRQAGTRGIVEVLRFTAYEGLSSGARIDRSPDPHDAEAMKLDAPGMAGAGFGVVVRRGEGNDDGKMIVKASYEVNSATKSTIAATTFGVKPGERVKFGGRSTRRSTRGRPEVLEETDVFVMSVDAIPTE